MLATAGQLPADARGWVTETKLDGCRSMARVYGEGAQLFSRPGNQLAARFPEVTAALATALDGRAAILDGELVTPDPRTGAPCFQLLQRRLAVPSPRRMLQASIPATLCVFDILNLDGADLTQLPYLQRRAILEELPLRGTKAIAVPPVWPDLAADVVLDVMRDLSLEGVVMKRADSTYQPGRRSKSWVKSVLRRRAAVLVCGWTFRGAAESVGSLVVGAHNASGALVYCGVVSSGLSRKARGILHARLSEIEAARPPFTDIAPSAAVRWVHPRLVAMIEYREFNGRFRHPAFKGLLRADPTIVPLPALDTTQRRPQVRPGGAR
jgi:bifunctional non-homologous end joining protein LigD